VETFQRLVAEATAGAALALAAARRDDNDPVAQQWANLAKANAEARDKGRGG
jgi:hypothetical protein